MKLFEFFISCRSLERGLLLFLHLSLPIIFVLFPVKFSLKNLPLNTCSIQRFLFVILQCLETVPDVDRASTHVCFNCCT